MFDFVEGLIPNGRRACLVPGRKAVSEGGRSEAQAARICLDYTRQIAPNLTLTNP